jgi:ferrochelatase
VRELKRLNMTDAFEWSVIDRWPNHQTHVAAVTETITAALAKFPADKQKDVVILFSAHSLPMRVVNRGDTYPKEVAATVQAVMDKLGHSHAHRLVWQSKVGFLPWLGAQTEESILGYHALGVKNLLLVPIAFTSDHIETLYELDIEYGQELVHKLGDKDLHIVRAESLNGSKTFIRGLAELVQTHLASGAMHSKCVLSYWRSCMYALKAYLMLCCRQLEARCPMCTTESCADMRSFFVKK